MQLYLVTNRERRVERLLRTAGLAAKTVAVDGERAVQHAVGCVVKLFNITELNPKGNLKISPA